MSDENDSALEASETETLTTTGTVEASASVGAGWQPYDPDEPTPPVGQVVRVRQSDDDDNGILAKRRVSTDPTVAFFSGDGRNLLGWIPKDWKPID